MMKITIAAALLAAGLSGAAQAGQHSIYTDADRAFYSDTDQARARASAPRQQYYQGGFGSFGGAAGMAKTLGY